MEDEDMFEQIRKGLDGLISEDTLENAKLISERWVKIGELIGTLDMNDTALEMDWVQRELKEIGVDINALLLMGLRIAISRNEPPTTFVATYVSGFVLGYLSCLEDQGTPVLDQLMEQRPESNEDEDESPSMGMLALAIESRTYSEPMNIEGLVEHVRKTSREICEEFTEPDDDWVPVIFTISGDQFSLIHFDIADERTKSKLFGHVIPLAVKKALSPVDVVAFVVSAWTLEDEAELKALREQGGEIKDHPNRTEALMLYAMDRAGEAQMWTAKILRDDEHPPGLGEWELSDVTLVMGRVPNMLRKIVS